MTPRGGEALKYTQASALSAEKSALQFQKQYYLRGS
jgi:hypothetical protein